MKDNKKIENLRRSNKHAWYKMFHILFKYNRITWGLTSCWGWLDASCWRPSCLGTLHPSERYLRQPYPRSFASIYLMMYVFILVFTCLSQENLLLSVGCPLVSDLLLARRSPVPQELLCSKLSLLLLHTLLILVIDTIQIPPSLWLVWFSPPLIVWVSLFFGVTQHSKYLEMCKITTMDSPVNLVGDDELPIRAYRSWMLSD